MVRIFCALVIFYGVVDGYIVFEKRHDESYVKSSVYQLFVIGDALARVVIPYCFARGILLLFDMERGK